MQYFLQRSRRLRSLEYVAVLQSWHPGMLQRTLSESLLMSFAWLVACRQSLCEAGSP